MGRLLAGVRLYLQEEKKMNLNQLFCEMIQYYRNDPKRIQHFTKVHSYAKLIGELSGMQGEELLTLEAAAYVHDIGIKVAEEKYGSSNGRLQEQEGPAVAEEMLGRLHFDEKIIWRVSYMVGHHHTYDQIDGLDYQILVEADFLVNLYEDGVTKEAVMYAYNKIFRTEHGKRICAEMFGIEELPMESQEKILVFCSREICYLSGNFFAHQLAAAFDDLGYETTVCEFTSQDDLDAVLSPFFGKKYRAVFDFNSLLPRLAMDDGTPVIDLIDGPFYDYIVDHQLFHYNCLMTRAKNFHAIVLDEGQADYVKKYHPQVKSVHMLPLGATIALFDGEKNPADHILFMGTYDAPEKVYDIVKAAPEPFCGMMKRIIEMRIAVPELPMEEAFAACLKEDDMELDEAQFALFMNTMYASDAYIRDYFRKAALDELLKKKIPVQLVGEGWEKYQTPYERYRTIEKPVTFDLSFEKIAREQIMLDVSPIFNRGVHDRAIAGMANRTVVLTDSNPYRCAHFKNRKDMMFYSLAKIDSLSEAAGELMENEKLRSEIRENAYQTFCAGHTWRARAKEILSWEAED